MPILFSMLCLVVKANHSGSIPSDVSDLLRHDKHAILYYPEGTFPLEDIYLITRQKTYHKGISNQEGNPYWLSQLDGYMTGKLNLPTDSVFHLCRDAYDQLVGTFEKELEDILQITIVPENRKLRNVPFAGLVKTWNGKDDPPRFLTEYWAVSYLFNFDFERTDNLDHPDQLNWDSTGAYLKGEQPRSGVHLYHRWPSRSAAFPSGSSQRFHDLVEGGYYTDEALGMTRSEYLDSLKLMDSVNLEALDPLRWASTIVYGEIAPLHTSNPYPWWVLVPIGLILVIVFGKRL